MRIHKVPNADGSVITVTSTASLIYDLINTAASTAEENAGYQPGQNGVDLIVEGEDIRVLFDGNVPTASKGILLKEGGAYSFRNVNLDKAMLIRTGNDSSVGVQIGKSLNGESSNISGGVGGGGGAAANVNIDTIGGDDVAPTAFRATNLDETAALAVKASGGNVYGWNLYNPNAYDVFVKFYNTAAGSVVVGTTAVVETVQVPALGSVVIKESTPIKAYSTAIAIAATKLIADNDATAIVSDVFAHIYYK